MKRLTCLAVLLVGCGGNRIYWDIYCGKGTELVDHTCVIAGTGSSADSGARDFGIADDGSDSEDTAVTDTLPPPPPPLAGCHAVGELASGSETLVDLFVLEAGILVVRTDALVLHAREGAVTKTVTWPRPILTAAFDGTTLVVGDKAAITVVDTTDLTTKREIFVAESCASGVLISGSRFVCGPGDDWQRVYYTYDLVAGTLLAKSNPVTYAGIPMQKVPGFDDFVTVDEELSPSDFSLHRVLDSGEATLIGDSPYHGDLAATRTYAFHSKSDRLITNYGVMLDIHPAGCKPMSSGCFSKAGDIGTLASGESFVAMADDGADSLYAVVSTAGSDPIDPPCESGCRIQRIDIPKHAVASETTAILPGFMALARGVTVLRHDPSCKNLLIGHATPTPTDTFAVGGHRIDVIAY